MDDIELLKRLNYELGIKAVRSDFLSFTGIMLRDFSFARIYPSRRSDPKTLADAQVTSLTALSQLCVWPGIFGSLRGVDKNWMMSLVVIEAVMTGSDASDQSCKSRMDLAVQFSFGGMNGRTLESPRFLPCRIDFIFETAKCRSSSSSLLVSSSIFQKERDMDASSSNSQKEPRRLLQT